ncbi:MAG: FAD-binding protein, partial [Rhizobiales bacterium]|nr:FAD-binding protein [Hyphomicrobiales bacterium]
MTQFFQEIRTDVLVVGSGGAALRAALDAQAGGASVTVAIKGEFRRSGATFHSVAEVGAFNVPDGAGDPGDSPDVFLDDILTAGQGMSDPRLSAILANEAEEALHFLESYGVHFERAGEEEGAPYLTFKACFS